MESVEVPKLTHALMRSTPASLSASWNGSTPFKPWLMIEHSARAKLAPAESPPMMIWKVDVVSGV
jgi:hypothetical protein